MESKETADAGNTFHEQNPFTYTTFPSREAMKAYYVQMSKLVNTEANITSHETYGLA